MWWILPVKIKCRSRAGDGDTFNVAWSPEGTRLAYQSTRLDNLDIYTYDLITKLEYRVTEEVGDDFAPTWDCSGVLVSFTSDRNTNLNVFEAPWQGGGAGNLTTNTADDKWSEWSPVDEEGSRN